MKFIITWLISSISLIIVAYIIPGISFTSFSVILFSAIILGIINAIIRPLIIILTIPINIITLGIFTFFINALMFWIVHLIVPGFQITNFMTAFWGAIIYLIINLILNIIFTKDNKQEIYEKKPIR